MKNYILNNNSILSNKPKNIFIIAGESSGDMHAASLIKEIKLISPQFSFIGIGGNEMKKESVKLMYDISQVNFVGFSSVMRNIKKIKSILKDCIIQIKNINPEAVILVDYPGFNLKLAANIKKFYRGQIIYYISPQVWAWHKGRIKIIKKFIDLMIVVFPFEVDFYKREDVDAEFVGHPLVKRIDKFLENNQREISQKLRISFLPGSRKDEINKMLPVLIKVGDKFKKEFSCEINIICSTNYEETYYREFINVRDFNLIYDKNNLDLNYKTILNSDLVVTKSGTSTIECALIGTPFCVVYKTGMLNYIIGKNLINVKNIAMANILLEKNAVKEFIQNEMNVENIFNESMRILFDKMYVNEMKNNFKMLREILTGIDASKNGAKLIVNFINNNSKF